MWNDRLVAWRALLAWLAGSGLTVLGLASLAGGVTAIYALDVAPTWTLALPAALLAVNLGAALAVHPVLRSSPGLLVFHVALLVFLVLVVAGRLTYLRGRVEVTEGTVFSGELNEFNAGPLHPWRIGQAAFRQGPFEIAYFADGRRGAIVSHVQWLDARGRSRPEQVTEHHPLVAAGYRFTPTANKGYAAVFAWRPDSRPPVVGSVHFPSYPLNAHRQSLKWDLPGGGPALWTKLEIDEPPLAEGDNDRFRLPGHHHLVVRRDTARWEVEPGGSINVAGGQLEYRGMRTWMGYTVFYDMTVPWLAAAAVVGCLGLAMHYALGPARHRGPAEAA